MRFYKHYFKKLLFAFLGVAFMGFGTGFNVNTGFGADPISVLFDGVSKCFNISLGTAINIFTVAFFILMLLFGRKYINIGTIFGTFLFGPFSDLAFYVYKMLSLNFPLRLISCVCGLLMLYFGIALFITANIGLDTINGVIMILKDKSKLDFRVIKVSTDILSLFIGFCLGGSFGVVSIISAIVAGPIIQKFKTVLSKERECI